ncbi:hypothetical protein H0H81_009614 [Sphagnurus paluster]|uniref:Uncharacterized protein n=1 Tax=Sphagnurus paluster TaxID=117069 RepID=A0A9P7FVG5_9AGAR|nr:hypothetical protein H0H81_009614 [Sphagnurus paluster]
MSPCMNYPEPTPSIYSTYTLLGVSTAEAILLGPRAESTSLTSSSTTISPTTTTDTPFFPDPSTLTPPPPSSAEQAQSQSSALARAVLEYAILVVALVIISCVLLQRYSRLRRANLPLSRFFSRLSPSNSTSPFGASQNTRFPRTTGLSHPYGHRTRAADTDAAGRRLGGPGFDYSDHDGYIGDKDMLPAYDTSGGPPKYGDMELGVFPVRGAVGGEDLRSFSWHGDEMPHRLGQEPNPGVDAVTAPPVAHLHR